MKFSDQIWSHDMARPIMPLFERLQACAAVVLPKVAAGDLRFVGKLIFPAGDAPEAYPPPTENTVEFREVRIMASRTPTDGDVEIGARFATAEDQQTFARWLFR